MDFILSRKQLWIGIALIVLAYLAMGLQSIGAPYFELDDMEQIFLIRSMQHWTELFGVDFYGFFRPVKNLLFALFLVLDGQGMPFVRSVALLVGLAAFAAVFAASLRLTKSNAKALMVSATWLLAPTMVSSYAWLSCVNITWMTACAAMALYFHDRACFREGNDIVMGLLATLALGLALVSYEGGISAIPILFAVDLYLHPERMREPRVWKWYGAYTLLAAVYLVFRLSMTGQDDLIGSFSNATRTEAMLVSAWFTLQHAAIWFWPFGGQAVVGGHISGQVSHALLAFSWAAIAASVVFSLTQRKRYPLISLGVAWFLIAFAPMSNLPGFMNGPWGDYYMNLASVGLAFGLTDLIFRLYSISPAHALRRVAQVSAIALVTLRVGAVAEAARWSHAWNDPQIIYAHTIQTFPKAFDAYSGLAKILADRGHFDEAQKMANRSLELAPDRILARPILSVVALQRNDIEAARGHITRYLAQRPADAWALGALGYIVEEHDGDTEAATALYRRALEKQPWDNNSIYAADRLAFIHAIDGDPTGAVTLWEGILQANPDHQASHRNLSIAYHRLGQSEKAAHHRMRAEQ